MHVSIVPPAAFTTVIDMSRLWCLGVLAHAFSQCVVFGADAAAVVCKQQCHSAGALV